MQAAEERVARSLYIKNNKEEEIKQSNGETSETGYKTMTER